MMMMMGIGRWLGYSGNKTWCVSSGLTKIFNRMYVLPKKNQTYDRDRKSSFGWRPTWKTSLVSAQSRALERTTARLDTGRSRSRTPPPRPHVSTWRKSDLDRSRCSRLPVAVPTSNRCYRSTPTKDWTCRHLRSRASRLLGRTRSRRMVWSPQRWSASRPPGREDAYRSRLALAPGRRGGRCRRRLHVDLDVDETSPPADVALRRTTPRQESEVPAVRRRWVTSRRLDRTATYRNSARRYKSLWHITLFIEGLLNQQPCVTDPG